MNDPARANADLHTRGTLPSDEQLLGRIRGEYLEMPGLRLTRRQAQRLWGLDDTTSDRILNALVERKFLTCAPDGAYMRFSDFTLSDRALHMVKADIAVETELFVARRSAARRS